MVKDPVCGMEVDEGKTQYSTRYRGETYFFCSEDCDGRVPRYKGSRVQKSSKVRRLQGSTRPKVHKQ
ncbi:MAG: YHS domain-containing protein [Deltaproteobacteria bacterium]|nr:YHS domain-containing protein [Deltaproteobacteria bacterium]